jgi:hypothetical protein
MHVALLHVLTSKNWYLNDELNTLSDLILTTRVLGLPQLHNGCICLNPRNPSVTRICVASFNTKMHIRTF